MSRRHLIKKVLRYLLVKKGNLSLHLLLKSVYPLWFDGPVLENSFFQKNRKNDTLDFDFNETHCEFVWKQCCFCRNRVYLLWVC